MKQSGILLFAILLYGSSFASVPRKPMLEEMTSTTCIFCDLSDSVVLAFEAEHGNSITVLKWYNDWRSREGENPFFNAFPAGAKRVNYYGVTGVPAIGMNGGNFINPYASRSLQILDSIFEPSFTMTSPYMVTVVQTIIRDSLECSVTVTLVDDIVPDSSLRLGIVISERIIYFQEKTSGTDYASPFHTNVVRTAIPAFTVSGAPDLVLPALVKNVTKTFSFHIHIDSIWNKSKLRTTAFIQNVSTREVLQSEFSQSQSTSVRTYQSKNSASALYPNPSSSLTMISFSLAETAHISAALYDIHGNRLVDVFDGELNAGVQSISFNASHLPSGMYYYRLQMGDHVETKPIVVAH